MKKKIFWIAAFMTGWIATLLADGVGTPHYQTANLAEDIAVLNQELGKLRMQVEGLQRENDQLKQQIAAVHQRRSESEAKFYAQVGEVKKEMLTMQQNVQLVLKNNNDELLKHFGQQMERLGSRVKNTVAQLKSSDMDRKMTSETSVFSNDYPKDGVVHVVEKGDTLSHIALKYHAKTRDIQNANKIDDPKSLREGQTLFIPQKSA